MVPVPGHFGRYVFALPAPDARVYVGLTDEDAPGPIPDEPVATEAEIDFLLDTINLALAAPLTRDDLLGTYSGLRPLLDTAEGSTADISRKHQVIVAPDGLVTIVGGKLTTYRRMAQDALDTALARSGVDAAPCRTPGLPLVGAAPLADLARVAAPARLVRRYGTEAAAVLDRRPGPRPADLRSHRGRRPPSCGSRSRTRVPSTSPTCSTGAPASGSTRSPAPVRRLAAARALG